MAAMDNGPDVDATPMARRACLVAGCGCRDARVLSRRRAAFFASRARTSGETANRNIEVEDDWRLPAAGVDPIAPHGTRQPMEIATVLLMTTELILTMERSDR